MALASERTAVASERIAEGTDKISYLIDRLLSGYASEPALLEAGREVQAQGFIAAFQAFERIVTAMLRAGYEFGVGQTGAIEISGSFKVLSPAQEQIIRTLAGDLRNTVLNATPSPTELYVLEERYRQHIVRWFESLQFQGLMRAPRPIVLALEDIYVELHAVAEVPEAADAFSIEERRLLLEKEGKDDATRRELMSQVDTFRRERWSRTFPERKSIVEALLQRDRRAFVILGDPGSGKTTLLHFLGLVYARGAATAAEYLKIDPAEADRLPIFVSLAAFDDMLRETPGLNLGEFLARYYDRRRGLPGLGPLFGRAFQSGCALVLLDGLDKVLDTGTRGYIAQQVGALINEWSPHGVRFVVSSRFVGYRETPVPGDLPILSLLDFGASEVETFVRRWSHAYEKWAANGEETPEMMRSARMLEYDLLTDVRSNESVLRLAANPLMLTMLALLRRQLGRLPHRRVQLYESYIGALLENWIDARSQGARERSVVTIDRLQAENILLPLALWLQKEKPSGTSGRVELHQKLTDIYLKEGGIALDKVDLPLFREAEEKANRFLREIRHITGLLVERGHDAFGFLHLTFQEYFAARALASLGDVERWDTIKQHLHDPRWREPILLTAGRLGVAENRRAQVTTFVRGILECPDSTEEKLHRNLLLALAIAGDDVNLETGLIDELVERSLGCLQTRLYVFIAELLGALGQLLANGVVVAVRCFERAWASSDGELRKVATKELARFSRVEAIRGMLLVRLNDSDLRVVEAALDALSSQVLSSDEVCRAVIGKLDDPDVCMNAARALASAIAVRQELISAVLPKLGNQESRIRRAALTALSAVVGSNLNVQKEVLLKVEDPDIAVGQDAVFILSKEAGAYSSVRLALIAKLGEASQLICLSIMRGLLPLASSDAAVRQLFLEGLSAPDKDLQRLSIQAFAEEAKLDERLRQSLFGMLADPTVRPQALHLLAKFAEVDEQSKDLLLTELKKSDKEDMASILPSVARLLISDPQLSFVLQREAKSISWDDRKRLIDSITYYGVGDRSFELLLQLRRNGTARESFAALEEAASAVPETVARLGQWRAYWLSKVRSQYEEERVCALVALTQSIQIDEKALRVALLSLRDESDEVRKAALASLSGVMNSVEVARQSAIEMLEDQSDWIRIAAFKTLAGRMDESALLGIVKNAWTKGDSNLWDVLTKAAERDLAPSGWILDMLTREECDIREAKLKALAGLVSTDSDARRAALAALEDEDFRIRTYALNMLSTRVSADRGVRGAVMERLGDENGHVRAAAIRALASVFGIFPEATEAILACQINGAFVVRLAAVQVMVSNRLEAINHIPFDQLRSWLELHVGENDSIFLGEVEVPKVRAQLANLFGQKLANDSSLRSSLASQLSAPGWAARCGAALSFLFWPGGPPESYLDCVLEALNDRRGLEAYPAQLTAASLLINRTDYAQESIDLCLNALDYGTRPWEFLTQSSEIRRQATLILGKLEPLFYNEEVYCKLVHAMENDRDSQVRNSAYGALVRLVRAREEAVTAARGGSS